MTESSNEKIVSRVQALLAKAESTTFPEEAEALVAKAEELMARYAIEDAVARQRRGATAKPEMRRTSIESPYITAKASLLAAVAGANGVRVVYNRAGDASLIGFSADIDIVEVLFASLLVQATGTMLRAPKDEVGRHVKAFRHAFLLAFAHRIGERLTEARAAIVDAVAADNGASLVPLFAARASAIDELVDEEFPYLRSPKQSISHYGGYGAGRAAANRADIGNSGRLNGSSRALAR
jgi:hypothetical protein